MDERDWRISELEIALKNILNLTSVTLKSVEGEIMEEILFKDEVSNIACTALYGGPNDCK